MVNFWTLVDKVIVEADIILLVCDARVIEQTRNAELIRKTRAAGKKLITVINKADLVDKNKLEPYKQKYAPCVFVSAQKFYGITLLRKMILATSHGEAVKVGVVGYPNTGKSSVINSLKGKSSASTSPTSGHTKALQNIKVDGKIIVIDTPGVLSSTDDKKDVKLIITASTTKTKDPELVVYELLEHYRKEILEHYDVKTTLREPEDVLEMIGLKLNRMKKGGEVDTETTARMILSEWQKSKIQI